MKSRLLGYATVLLGAAPCFATNTLADAGDLTRHYAATATIALVPQEGLQRLSLPLPVLQASRSAQWADVRVLDSAGRPVPTAWLPAQLTPNGESQASLTSAPLPLFTWPNPPGAGTNTKPSSKGNDLTVQVDSAGAVVKIESSRAASADAASAPQPTTWLVDLSALPRPGRTVQQLQLDWPTQPQGLSTRVAVEASDDAQRWTYITSSPLLELPTASPASATTNELAAVAAPSVKHVDWPAGVAMPRYLRLRFEQPLALSRAQLHWQAALVPVALNTTPAQFQFVSAEGNQPAHWALDLQGPVPVQQLQLDLPQPNTVLGLRLEQRNDSRQPWQSVASFVAWRLRRDGAEQRSPPAQWNPSPATATRYWRLVPDARTAQPPAQPLNATIAWAAPQLLLVAQGGGELRLAVGREHDSDNSVAWQTLVPGADSAALTRLPQAHLGELTPRAVAPPDFSERIQTASPEDQRRWMLWAVLAVAVLGLGGLAWRLARDIKVSDR